jgi:hypothetical protein
MLDWTHSVKENCVWFNDGRFRTQYVFDDTFGAEIIMQREVKGCAP